MAIDRTSDQFLLDAYNGQGGFATGEYLIAHPRETETKLERRQALAVYPNFVRKIVDVYMGFLWKQAPNREHDDLYGDFLANADGAGTKLNTLLFCYQRLAMILGTVYVIVDKPQQQGQTRAEQALPYLAMRFPGQLVDEVKDAAGTWQSVTFSELLNNKTVYRTYTLTGWRVSRNPDGSEVIEQGDYTLNRVPVVRLHIAKPLNPIDSRSQSWVYDLAILNWDLYNTRSELRELFRAQTFAILALPVTDDSERERLKDLTISTENALTYNPSGGGEPSFIAPPADPVELYMKQIADTVQDIYRIANLEFVGGVQQSGVATAFYFQQTNSSMGGMAEMCESAESDIARLVYLWQGREFNGNISYNNEFNMTDLAQAISTVMDTVTLGMGSKFDKAIKKRLAKQVLGNDICGTDMEAIGQEIDAQGDLYGDRLAREGLASAPAAVAAEPVELSATLESTPPVDLSGLDSRMDALETAVDGVKTAVTAGLQAQPAPNITVEAPVINVTVPEQPPAQITVEAPVVNVTVPEAQPVVNQPQQPVVINTGSNGKIIDLVRDANGAVTGANVRESNSNEN
ncbi:MAG: hypothetical protein Q7U98_17195 [Methylicorpusculum sp.]|uniref:hypothetical protein n=1 Tax=Methylicorpusculum sp. TaxID=2713644 RepID=UPI00271CB1E2|nr:hypothetical protein [Methylicorpusculum sp.]MDO8940893.1 hypothetical protein [Methylicorpusculum sp.]MDP2202416.1 hypothetical protein [Methylicorpusculum sp.]